MRVSLQTLQQQKKEDINKRKKERDQSPSTQLQDFHLESKLIIIIIIIIIMCNPNTSTSSTTTTTTKEQPQSHLFLDLLSLSPNTPPPPPPPPTKALQQKPTVVARATKLPDLIVTPAKLLPSIAAETRSLLGLAFPIALTALILYSRSAISMLFLGRLGELELAAGSLAIAFANITGYSVLSGLALGMEPLCSQAFGANRPSLLAATLHRSVIFLLLASLPISFLWLNTSKILLALNQDPQITSLAQTYLLFSLPDLLTNSFIHPIRIYLRAQGVTAPVTLASLAGAALHLPANIALVAWLRLGARGVALASALSNLSVLASLACYVWVSDVGLRAPSHECLTGWKPLLRLAAPSCVSVCLEWWWYEIMIVLCGLLADPKVAVASMGVLIQTTSLIYVFPSSLGFAVSTRVGNELGANRPERARLSAAVAVVMAFAAGLAAAAFAFGVRGAWGSMFTRDEGILRLTSAALPILGLCELGNCPQTVGCGVLRGSARPCAAANVNVSAFYLVGMPVAVGLSFWAGVGFSGLWLGLLSAQVCCAGLMLYVVGTTDWELQAKRAQLLTCAESNTINNNNNNNNSISTTSCCSSSKGVEEEQPLICIVVASQSQP